MSTDTSPPLIECRNLTRSYTLGSQRKLSRSKNRPTVTALDTISISIDRGEVVGLSGPSGSGKSTLLHLIAGLDTPTSGTVTFDGTDLSTLSGRNRTKHRLENVGIVFQHFHLLDALSARGNVALPLVELGIKKRDRRARAEEILEAVGLGDRITHKPAQLSGGEQQRVAIARALVTNPRLVIADEPTGELDTETGAQVLDRFTSVAEDTAIVLATHDPETLAIADRVISLRDGKLVVDETDSEGTKVTANPHTESVSAQSQSQSVE